MNTPSGWYPDTTRTNTERYWDGSAWTEQARFPGVKPFESPVPDSLAEPQMTTVGLVSMFQTSTVGYSLPPDLRAKPEAAQNHRPRRPVVVKGLSLLLAMVLVGGGAFWASSRHADADAAVTDAVTSALASHSADFTLSGSGSSAGQDFTLRGTGALNFDQNAMQMSFSVSGGSESISAQAVYLDQEMYMNLGPEIGQILPGKSWISLDVGQLSQEGGAAQSLGASGPTLTADPAAALQALSQNGNTVTDLGSSSINGVNVEGYSVHIDSAGLNQAIAQGQLPSWMQEAAGTISNPDVDYRVFVDGSGQLIRMTSDVSETLGGVAASGDVTMDFSNYGATVDVTAPPTGEVGTFQNFLQAAGNLSGSSSLS